MFNTLKSVVCSESRRRHAKLDISIVRTGHAPAQANLLPVRRLCSRALPNHPRPHQRRGKGADVSVWRRQQIRLAAGRRMALPVACQGQQRRIARWTLVCRIEPHSAARMRRDRRSRHKSFEPISAEADDQQVTLMSGAICGVRVTQQDPDSLCPSGSGEGCGASRSGPPPFRPLNARSGPRDWACRECGSAAASSPDRSFA
jgi:hypothetical protein